MAKIRKITEQQLSEIEFYAYGGIDLDHIDDFEEVVKESVKIVTGKVATQKLFRYIMLRVD